MNKTGLFEHTGVAGTGQGEGGTTPRRVAWDARVNPLTGRLRGVRNALLLTGAMICLTASAGAFPPPSPLVSQPAPTTQPPREPSATEVLDSLAPPEGVARPIVRPNLPGQRWPRSPAPEARPPNAVVPIESKLLPDGYRLIDRPGRLQREGDYWVFAFESRSTRSPEPPIRLLPNRMLEDMEIASAGGTRPVVFLISGEVTEYHGVNYLLLQKMLIRPELGNLK